MSSAPLKPLKAPAFRAILVTPQLKKPLQSFFYDIQQARNWAKWAIEKAKEQCPGKPVAVQIWEQKEVLADEIRQ